MAEPDAWTSTPASSGIPTCAAAFRPAATPATASPASPRNSASPSDHHPGAGHAGHHPATTAAAAGTAATPPLRGADHRSGGRAEVPGRPGAYLADRLIEREWLLADVAAELGADRRTARRLMQQAGVTRRRRTTRQLAAGARGRRVQSVSWQARRAELGFADLAAYLQARYV